jgi:hypothetical protein
MTVCPGAGRSATQMQKRGMEKGFPPFLPEAQEVLWVLRSMREPQDGWLEDCTGYDHLKQQEYIGWE